MIPACPEFPGCLTGPSTHSASVVGNSRSGWGIGRELSFEDGQESDVMCELTKYGNYLYVNQGTMNVLSLKADGHFAVSLNLQGGGEIHIETAD